MKAATILRRPWPRPESLALALLPLALAAASEATAALPPGWPAYASAVVAADGSGQFHSLQAAIAAAPAGRPGRAWIIHVRPGVYRERLYVPREQRFLAIVGEDAERTIVTFDLHANVPDTDGRPIGTFRTATAQVDADDFTAEGLTFENAAGPVAQALALRVDGDRAAFRKCRFVGWQDSVLLNRGRQYFEGCFISGHVDFIFGGATAFFDRCAIVVRRDGYVTAASTPDDAAHGFVFSRCTVRGESSGERTYPWRSSASVVFLATEMSEVVRPEGWHNWNRPEREKTARYGEHGTTGPGASPGSRVPWARLLSADEAAALTSVAVLGGTDGWDPASQGSVIVAAAKAAPPATDTAPPCPPPASFERDVEYDRLDARRLALVGESAGGHLVADAAVRMTDDTRVAAVVPFFAPVDFESDTDGRGGLSVSLRALFGRTELDEAARQALREASPIRRVRPGLPPFLLVHGTADMSVPYEQSIRLQKALREAGVECDLVTVPDGTHGTREWDEQLPGYPDQVVGWLVERIGR